MFPREIVREAGPDRLAFDTRSPVVVAVLRVNAGVAIVLGLAAGVLALTEGGAASLLGGAGAAMGGGLGWVALRRARMQGAFVVDGATRTVQRVGTGEQWGFDPISAITLVVDPTDGMRPDLLPGLPHWRVARTRGGARLRLAKGGRGELGTVVTRLGELGLPIA